MKFLSTVLSPSKLAITTGRLNSTIRSISWARNDTPSLPFLLVLPLPNSTTCLAFFILSRRFEEDELLEVNHKRKVGKTQKYSLGTIFVNNDYLLTAFSKFDDKNRAFLTMPDYLAFLINFWDKVNRIYAQKSVSVPIFGSGITRIKEHKNISDEDLLKIMLWTFRISEMRFKFPAKLTIVIHKDKIDKINLLDIKSARNGL